jgi:hypothetical protein
MAPTSSALRHFATEESLRKFFTAASFIANRERTRGQAISRRPETPAFTATSPLPGGWTIASFVPGERLTLARAGRVEAKDAARRLFVVLGATAMIIAISVSAEHVSREFFWVLAPLLVLLLVVVVFGLLALLRSARRATASTHLLVDAKAGLVSGFAATQTLPTLRIEPIAALKALTLEVRRGAGTNAREPKSWATLELSLTDGTRLEAPDAWGPDELFEETEALLLPLGRELSRLSGRPLEVTRLWTGETRTVAP